MAIVLDGTNGINTPDLESAGPVSGTTGTFSGAVQASGVATNIYPLVSATAVTASGTAVDFTGIPSWVKRITVMFNGVSLSGSSYLLAQIGAGSVTSSGYTSVASANGNTNAAYSETSSAGFVMATGNASFNVYATATICLVSGNTWVCSHTGGASIFYGMSGGGGVILSGTLDRVRITTTNGTDTFDAGTINILYEG
jgi:hypothetical protein